MIERTVPLGVLATIAKCGAAQAGDRIIIVGSSTVYPFAIVVPEKFGKESSVKTPKLGSTGSGGGRTNPAVRNSLPFQSRH